MFLNLLIKLKTRHNRSGQPTLLCTVRVKYEFIYELLALVVLDVVGLINIVEWRRCELLYGARYNYYTLCVYVCVFLMSFCGRRLH